MNKFIKLIIILIILIILLLKYYNIIPTKQQHINRNKYNIKPSSKLTHIDNLYYKDSNNIIWKKRTFLNSLLHNPFKYYIFETYNINKISSSEVEISINTFLSGIYDAKNFNTSSFNYYSSFNSKILHFFADVLPIFIYLNSNYTIYN